MLVFTFAGFSDELRGHYSFEKENGTLNLIGHFFDNDTTSGELLNEMEIGVYN